MRDDCARRLTGVVDGMSCAVERKLTERERKVRKRERDGEEIERLQGLGERERLLEGGGGKGPWTLAVGLYIAAGNRRLLRGRRNALCRGLRG